MTEDRAPYDAAPWSDKFGDEFADWYRSASPDDRRAYQRHLISWPDDGARTANISWCIQFDREHGGQLGILEPIDEPTPPVAPRSLSDVLIDAFAALDRLDASAQGAINLHAFDLYQKDADDLAKLVDFVAPVRVIVAVHPQLADLAAIRRALELIQPPICPRCYGDCGQLHDYGGGTAWEPCPACQPHHLTSSALDDLAAAVFGEQADTPRSPLSYGDDPLPSFYK